MNHTWTIETVDGGSIGLGDFWYCPVCGSSGGPVVPAPGGLAWESEPSGRWSPFYADGSGLKTGRDCARAAEIIREHLARRY